MTPTGLEDGELGEPGDIGGHSPAPPSQMIPSLAVSEATKHWVNLQAQPCCEGRSGYDGKVAVCVTIRSRVRHCRNAQGGTMSVSPAETAPGSRCCSHSVTGVTPSD